MQFLDVKGEYLPSRGILSRLKPLENILGSCNLYFFFVTDSLLLYILYFLTTTYTYTSLKATKKPNIVVLADV